MMLSPDEAEFAHFIGNRWRTEDGARTIPVVDPGTAERLADGPVASAMIVDEAVRTATRAFPD